MTDREKLVNILKSQPYGYHTYEEMVDYLIANNVTVQEWISVEDELPEDEQEVIGWEGEYARTLYYNAETNEWDDEYGWRWELDNFPHWMPLPETPKVINTKICNYSQEQPILQIKLKQDKPENWVVKEDLSLYEKIGKQYSIEQSSYKSCEHSYVEPVKHGEWEHDICSICGAEWFDWTNMRPFTTNYCPSCGAKMNGGKES